MARVLLAAVAVGLVAPATARAQFFGPPPFAPAFGYRAGFGFSFGGPGRPIAGFAGGYYARYAVVAPPYLPFYGWGPGWGPGYGSPYFLPPPAGLAPPVVVVPPPIVVVAKGTEEDGPPVVAPAGAIGNPNVPRLKPQPPADVIVIAPKKPGEGEINPKVDRVAPPQPPPRPAFDPFAKPDVWNVEKAEADPAAEHARLLRLAERAFAAGEYGLAAEQLDRAIRVRPAEAVAYFLKAQVRFASGEYAAAVAAVREGLARAPDWPASRFAPRELYGANPGRFDVHLGELRQAAAANPGDPTLGFLLAYELWFGGDRPAAARLFRELAGKGKDAAAETFVREADARRIGP